MFSRAGFACFAALCARSARADALDSIVRAMSVADKVGQMTQVDISVMMTDGALDKRKLAYWLGEVRVGSILNSPLSGRDCAAAGPTGLSAHEWRAIVRGVQAEAQRLGLPPVLFGLDSVHGATYVRGATLFGHQIALAATFDRGIVEAVGAAQARDTIAAGVPWLFSPILDLATHPAFPRVYETFGEDPLVASQLGVAMIRGMQAETGDADLPRAAACMKHFFAYAHPANGHDRAPVSVHEGALRDSYLRPFTAAVREAGVLSAMNSYNELNGVPIVASRKWLRRVLRDELGFAGLLVTDWGEINNLHSFHHAAQSEEAAVLLALERTSIDMSMVPLDNSFSRHVLRLVRTGALPVGRVDESVSRVLALKERLGLFRSPVPSNETPLFSRVGKDGELALESARASVTLLLNRGLPPAPSAERVCGPVLLDAGATSSHDLPGGSFSRADVPDAAECRARCEAEAACAVWLFMGSWRASHPDWPICFLKSAAASISRGDDNARNAAGTCAPLPTPAVLPLDPARGARRRLLLTGPTSDSLVFQAGGWSVRWQGGCRDSDFEAGGETVRQALGRLLPDGVELVHTPGCTIDAPTHATATCGGPAELAAALDAALSADVAIVALGEENYTEKPGDIDDLALHAGQLELVRALAAHAPHVPIILVLISGRPRLLNGLPQLSSVVAVVWAGVPGPHGGTAIAEVLLGMTNPSGRLPLTYPALPNALGTHYQTHAARCSGSAGGYLSGGTTDCPVEFPFGHGLSYTRFEYSDADSAPARVLHPGTFGVSLAVTNRGEREGRHTVLLYATQQYRSSGVAPERQRLVGFSNVRLQPGEQRTVVLSVPTALLSFHSEEMEEVVESGVYTLHAQSDGTQLLLDVTVVAAGGGGAAQRGVDEREAALAFSVLRALLPVMALSAVGAATMSGCCACAFLVVAFALRKRIARACAERAYAVPSSAYAARVPTAASTLVTKGHVGTNSLSSPPVPSDAELGVPAGRLQVDGARDAQTELPLWLSRASDSEAGTERNGTGASSDVQEGDLRSPPVRKGLRLGLWR